MGALDLIDTLDVYSPHWRDGDISIRDDDIVEELLYWFLTKNPSWLDDITPPCIKAGDELEWLLNLFAEDAAGVSVRQARYSAFGYCEKAIVEALLYAEKMAVAYG